LVKDHADEESFEVEASRLTPPPPARLPSFRPHPKFATRLYPTDEFKPKPGSGHLSLFSSVERLSALHLCEVNWADTLDGVVTLHLCQQSRTCVFCPDETFWLCLCLFGLARLAELVSPRVVPGGWGWACSPGACYCKALL